jgi:hypothetical protein
MGVNEIASEQCTRAALACRPNSSSDVHTSSLNSSIRTKSGKKTSNSCRSRPAGGSGAGAGGAGHPPSTRPFASPRLNPQKAALAEQRRRRQDTFAQAARCLFVQRTARRGARPRGASCAWLRVTLYYSPCDSEP